MKKAAQKSPNKKQLARMRPDELWNNNDIDAHKLVRVDRLDITAEIVERAEHPELEDFVLSQLPP